MYSVVCLKQLDMELSRQIVANTRAQHHHLGAFKIKTEMFLHSGNRG